MSQPFLTNVRPKEEVNVHSSIVNDETGIDFMGGLVPSPLALPKERILVQESTAPEQSQ